MSNFIYYSLVISHIYFLFATMEDNTKREKRNLLQLDGCKLFVLLCFLCVKEK